VLVTGTPSSLTGPSAAVAEPSAEGSADGSSDAGAADASSDGAAGSSDAGSAVAGSPAEADPLAAVSVDGAPQAANIAATNSTATKINNLFFILFLLVFYVLPQV
jgi:hypothetical protein